MSPGAPPARPSLPAPPAGQFYSFIRSALIKDVRRAVRQEIRSAHKPGRRRGGRGAELRRKEDFRQEKLRRLQQSIGDRSRSTSLSSHAASTHSCSAHSSSLVQVACDGRRRKFIFSSLVAWRRYSQVTRCARDYRANNSRSNHIANHIVKPVFQCWRRSAVRTSTQCLWPDLRARSFVPTRVDRPMREVLAISSMA